MITWLLKPFGYDNYLVVASKDDLLKLFETLLPGDEFVLRVAELSQEDFDGLENFNGFSGPTENEEEQQEEQEEEEQQQEEEQQPSGGPIKPKKA